MSSRATTPLEQFDLPKEIGRQLERLPGADAKYLFVTFASIDEDSVQTRSIYLAPNGERGPGRFAPGEGSQVHPSCRAGRHSQRQTQGDGATF